MFWQSKKFAYTVLATGAFLTLALTHTVEITSEQALLFTLSVLGGNLVTHTATDIASIFKPGEKE